MTNRFASRVVLTAAAAVLASIVATSADARIAEPTAPQTLVLFFDTQSAFLTPEAKTIVLSAVDAVERGHAGRIELAAYAAPDETARDPDLASRRAAAVKEHIANYGFQGVVIIDDEARYPPLVAIADDTLQRLAILRISD